ncbi:MAG TPA: hypothetical protein VLZ50_01980 [Terracidiphilus sp.]|nr:hypothetical protein [Terracidiphilus sp.]
MAQPVEVAPLRSRAARASAAGTQEHTAARLGFWAALILAFLTPATFAIAIATPPRSGPFCTGTCFGYPYMGAVQFVPRDFLWCYPAVFLLPAFVMVVACLRYWVAPGMRPLSLVALVFAAMAAGLISTDYFLQIEVVQPSLLKAEPVGLALLSQYNPHGIFIALEDLGYLILSVAFCFAGAALPRVTRSARMLRWILMLSFPLMLVSYAWMTWRFGTNLEMRFELAAVTIDWTVLTAAGILLALFFRRCAREP